MPGSSHVTSLRGCCPTSQVTTIIVTMLLVVHHIVGAAEIGRMLGGVSRQRVQQLINRKDFPKPEAELEMGKVWARESVVTWARDHGRAITGDDESAGA